MLRRQRVERRVHRFAGGAGLDAGVARRRLQSATWVRADGKPTHNVRAVLHFALALLLDVLLADFLHFGLAHLLHALLAALLFAAGRGPAKKVEEKKEGGIYISGIGDLHEAKPLWTHALLLSLMASGCIKSAAS